MAGIKTFTSTGRAVAYKGGIKGIQIGHVVDGKIYPHPRLRADGGLGASSRVRLIGPSGAKLNERTASLGEGGVGQRGRFQDYVVPEPPGDGS